MTEHFIHPVCNYHRQDEFREMVAETEADLLELVGVGRSTEWLVAILTSTGTGANEACLIALAATGRGLIVENGFFGARLAAQARACGIDHTHLVLPHDQPIDAAVVDDALRADPSLGWVYFVSHETRTGLENPTIEIGRAASRYGVLVAADVVSHAFGYPLDLEAAGLDLAVTSSAKALMSVPGLGIVFARAAALSRLAAVPGRRSYYLDLVAELEMQRREHQPRFAQPVALHAALSAACKHLRAVGIDNHMRRIRTQMLELTDHLAALGLRADLDPQHRSWVAVNFRLPVGLDYPAFSRRMQQEGYYLLYGVPGDHGHFQISTIGDLTAGDVDGLKHALTRVLGRFSLPAGATLEPAPSPEPA